MLEVMTMPFQISEEEYDMIVAIPQVSIDRIKQYDPVELNLHQIGEPFSKLRLRELHITYYNEQDDLKIKQMVRDHDDPIKIAKLLTRGWKYRPDLGDNDLPPMTLRPDN